MAKATCVVFSLETLTEKPHTYHKIHRFFRGHSLALCVFRPIARIEDPDTSGGIPP